MKSNSNALKWNTGRSYTEHGQRIAATTVAPNGVLVVDVDRGIEYFLPDCPLNRSVIMARYDGNDRTMNWPREEDCDTDEKITQAIATRNWLIAYAKEQ